MNDTPSPPSPPSPPTSDQPETPQPLGCEIIDAVIRAKALESAIVEPAGTVFVWSANAAEQIEAALAPYLIRLGIAASMRDDWVHEALMTFTYGVKTLKAPPIEAMRRAFASIYLRMMGLEAPVPGAESL